MNIQKNIISLNKCLPEEYLKRNMPQYEYVSYVNHIIVFYLSEQWKSCQWFIKRTVELERKSIFEINEDYGGEVNELIEEIIKDLKINRLILEELQTKFEKLGIV